jgi:hypothetical protein
MTLLNRLKLRTSVLAVVLGTASFGGLAALERVAPDVRATTVNADLQSSQQNDSGPKDGDHDKHCDDGKGKDGEKNKHCRPVSGHEDPCDDNKKHDDCDEHGDHDGDHGDHGDDHGHDGHDDRDDNHGGGKH